jgi:hypothetical protein
MAFDTPQPATAGETETRAEGIANAAEAFKAFTSEEPVRPRGPDGKFVSAEPAADEEEIEAEEGEQSLADAESHEEVEETDEAADEAQPEAVDLPTSWAADKAELWSSLPPEAQEYISARDGERDRAVNAKFQEAANVLRSNEGLITEAQTNRQKFADAADYVLALVQPQKPDPRHYGAGTGQFDHEGLALANADYEQAISTIEAIRRQRDDALAQEKQEAENAEKAAHDAIEATAAPAFAAAYPAIRDQAKAPAFFNDLVAFAVERGVPQEAFTNTNSAELHILADAHSWRKHLAAKAKVQTDPKPEPRKAQPAVRPGVATSRSAIGAANRAKDFGRLDQTGSIQDGAAMWKHFLKEK